MTEVPVPDEEEPLRCVHEKPLDECSGPDDHDGLTEEVEVAAKALYRRDQGTQWRWETDHPNMRAAYRYDAKIVLAAVRPVWEKRLDELRSENERLRYQIRIAPGYPAEEALREQRDVLQRLLDRRETDLAAVRAELERVRAAVEEVAERFLYDAVLDDPLPGYEQMFAAIQGLPVQPKEQQ